MDFNRFWTIYDSSFPPDEKRSYKQQLALLDVEQYHVECLENQGVLLGFIAYWTFEKFIFIEHLALAPEARGLGAGSSFLKSFLEAQTLPIILEVEPPRDEIQRRRVVFYERLGFSLSEYTHVQKPYVKGRQGVRLQLMSYPVTMDQSLFEMVNQTLFSTIYSEDEVTYDPFR